MSDVATTVGSHLTETFVFKDQYPIKWGRYGDNANPPVILVHGFPFSSLEWLPIAQAISRDYNVYLWDFPGFGASLDNPAVSLAMHGEVFAGLYSHWGFSDTNRPHVIAHDIGGHATLRAHLMHGTKFASLCLLNILAVLPWGSPFLRAVMANPQAFTAVPLAMFTGLLREYVQLAASSKLTEAKMSDFVGPWKGTEGQERFLSQVTKFDQKHTEEMEGKYGDVMAAEDDGPKRLKIIWAEDDNLIPLGKGQALANVTGAAQFVRVPKAGHLVMVDQPEIVTYEIVVWLQRNVDKKDCD